MVTKDTLKQWFSNGKKPDEQQFWAWLESYWHKDEKIPIETIQDIQTILSGKSDTELVNKLIEELKGKVDTSVVEALQQYINGLINDSLTEADNKTYSINKINEITKGLITEAVTDVDYNAETGVLIVEYEVEKAKEINLPKDNFLSEVKYSPETKDITFTMSNGSVFTVNVAELVDTYEATPNGGLEVINSNQFQIKEKGVNETMLSQELQEKLSKTGNVCNLQNVIDNQGDKEVTGQITFLNGSVIAHSEGWFSQAYLSPVLIGAYSPNHGGTDISAGTISIRSADSSEFFGISIYNSYAGFSCSPNVARLFQSDWGEVDTTQITYIKNKPDFTLKADLVNGKVPAEQLPSYVSSITNVSTYNSLPTTGDIDKIYVTNDTNKCYRWTGVSYIEIAESLALGETSLSAYRGDRGKASYDHSLLTSGNPHNVTKYDIGLGNVDNVSDDDKPLSRAVIEQLSQKQKILESGTSIKTVNNVSLLGSGNVPFPTTLPNPNVLTFTGGASATYNGSSDVTVNIPTGYSITQVIQQNAIPSAVGVYFTANVGVSIMSATIPKTGKMEVEFISGFIATASAILSLLTSDSVFAALTVNFNVDGVTQFSSVIQIPRSGTGSGDKDERGAKAILDVLAGQTVEIAVITNEVGIKIPANANTRLIIKG